MKLLGLTSRYARLGIFSAGGCLLLAALFAGTGWSFQVNDSYVVIGQPNAYVPTKMDWSGVGDIDWEEFARDQEMEASRAFADGDSKEPCFDVVIDEKVEGYEVAYRTDLFGGNYIGTQETLIKEIEAGLTTSFLDKTWEMDRDCFSGSFVVSFDVEEDGTLGKNMLVHHLRGGSSNAAFAILEVLWEMERSGHTWHDGTQGAGEIRIPVSFRLL